jgi:hypothetical protein
MTNKKRDIWDVVVIGGGPAGMMAAGRAAESGCSVLLLEKNPTLGKKLLITGGGRCNVTNNRKNIRDLAVRYEGADQFLMSAFSQFDVARTLDFFHRLGMPTKEEAEGRIFPSSDSSQSVLDVLTRYMHRGGVKVWTNATINGLAQDGKKELIEVYLKEGRAILARACILATGGVSHPETGSTGEGFKWLKKLGHTIGKNSLALVPLAIKDKWVKKLAGLTLTDIKITIQQYGEKQGFRKGKILFTHFGVSGPTILNMSKSVGNLLAQDEVQLLLDLFPKLDHGALKEKFQLMLAEDSNKKLKNSLAHFVPAALVPVLLNLAGIDGDIPNNNLRRENRIRLLALMKAIPLQVDKLLGADKAIVSSGGVAPQEVNFKTMQSRIIPGLYLVGDVLDINRPSGGYSLQLCWTTGYVVGTCAGQTLD